MKAFVEVLSVIVRCGDATDAYGLPFSFAVGASSVDGRTAIVKALTKSDVDFEGAHARAIIKALKSPLPAFSAVDWERFK